MYKAFLDLRRLRRSEVARPSRECPASSEGNGVNLLAIKFVFVVFHAENWI